MPGIISMLLSNIIFLATPLCRSFLVEISLTEKNESRNLKLVCGPPEAGIQMKDNHTVLWQGSQFGNDEQQNLAERLDADALLIPNISVNSSDRHRCYLLTARNEHYKGLPKKKRNSKDSAASIPMENGVCPPGHRIDQDQCFACFPGSYTSGQATECFLCPKDFYMTKNAADACWPCPEGKKTLAQGADSEDSCIYFDDKGNPVLKQSPPMVLIFSIVGVLIAAVWIILIILWIRYFRESDEEDLEQGKGKVDGQSQTPLLQSTEADDHEYATISEYRPSDSEEHIYGEIGDYDDIYEEPIKPSQAPLYAKIASRDGKLKERRKSSMQRRRESVDVVDSYEKPRRRSTDSHLYEVPIQRNTKSDGSIRSQASDENYMYDDIEGNEGMGNDKSLAKSRSLGFEPRTSTAVLKNKKSGSKQRGNAFVRSGSVENRKQSSQNVLEDAHILSSGADKVQEENTKIPQDSKFGKRSDEKMDSIAEEQAENMDDLYDDIESDEPEDDKGAESDSETSVNTPEENESLE